MAGDKYAALRAEFVDGAMSIADLARAHGVPEGNLQTVAARQKWTEKRQEKRRQRQETSERAAEMATERAAMKAAEEVAALWARARIQAAENFVAAQELQAAAIRALQDGEKPPSAHEARALMGSAVDGIRGLHMATGEPTEITEHRGGLALADRETLDAMMQEVMKE